MRLQRWGIATRAAVVSAVVVLLALCITGYAIVLGAFYQQLVSVDNDSATRVREIVSALQVQEGGPAALDATRLATNDHVVAVQIIDAAGTVVARSPGAPQTPLAAPAEFGPQLQDALRDDMSPNDDMRLTGQSVETASGRYTVIVGGGSKAAESALLSIGAVLLMFALIVTAAAALATYWLVRRSLRSVETIRRQVADISAAGLKDRVPVPVQRDEISALAETMNAMLGRIETANHTQRQFVGDASHELRSPLATIISALEVADAHPDLLSLELANGVLLPEAQRMRALVDDLLLLARADERALSVRAERVQLDQLLDSEATRLRYTTTLTIATEISAAGVVGDNDALVRMIRNLLDNAERYTSTLIELALSKADGLVILAIGDDGPGIPARDRARVFDRFVRLEEARSRRGGGTGLGLAIVAEIVVGHQGSVRIGDREGGGTTVTVVLPVTESLLQAPGDPLERLQRST